MEKLNLYIPLTEGLPHSVNNDPYDVIMSRECTLRELLDCISELPTRVTFDVHEINGNQSISETSQVSINEPIFARKVMEVSVIKHSDNVYFHILIAQCDVKPLSVSFKQTSPIGGDETAAYLAEFSRECTLNELVALLLTHKDSWGAIYYQGSVVAEYKRGKLEYLNALWKEKCGNSRIKSCKASGGWGQMNYYL